MTAVDTDINRQASVSDAGESGLRRSALFTFIEVAIYLAFALLIIWPVTPDLTTRIVGSGDAESYLWMNWRVSRMIASGNLLPTVIPDAMWPYGSNLLVSDGYLPVYIGALWNLVFPPVLAFNFAVLTTTILNFWSARTLAQRFSTRRSVWIISALAFGTAPAIAIRYFGHYTFTFAFTAPLILALAIDVARGRPVPWIRLGLLFYVAYLCSIFYLLYGATGFLLVCVFARPCDWKSYVPRLAAASVIALVLMSPFIIERFRLDAREGEAGGKTVLSDEAIDYSADAEALYTQPPISRFEVPGQNGRQAVMDRNLVEATIFPGFLLLLSCGAVVLLRTRWRWPLLGTAAVMWIMALGPTLKHHSAVVYADSTGLVPIKWLPFAALQSLPGLGMIRTPNRASFTLVAILVATAAIALDWLFGWLRTNIARALAVVGSGALLLTNLLIPVNWATMETSPAIKRALEEIHERAHDDEAVVFIPADCGDDLNNNSKLQIEFRQPMLGCHANYASIPWYSGIDRLVDSKPLAGLRCDAGALGRRPMPYPGTTTIDAAGMRELYESLGVRFYIYDKGLNIPEACTERVPAIAAVVAANSETLAEDDRWAVYDAFPEGAEAEDSVRESRTGR